MTAEQAIASIREDIDYLEAKKLVKPGHIRRRRSEVDAIAQELLAHDAQLFQAEARIADLEQAHQKDALRLGMLANMLTVLGFAWERRIGIANEHEAEVMLRAARIACEHNVNRSDGFTPKWKLDHAFNAATLAARIEIALERIAHHTPAPHEEEKAAA